MKKILFLLFILVAPVKIFASETIYSEYSSFSPFQEDKITSNELTDVKMEDRYLFYKNVRVEGEYQPVGSGYTYSKTCYNTEYSEWGDDQSAIAGRLYQTRVIYNYELAKKVRYIHLTDLQGSYGAFRIPELLVKINGSEIDYTYECVGCLEDFDEYIHNGNYVENESHIENGGSLIIDLGKEYPIDDIELVFYIFDLGPSTKKYTLGYSQDRITIYPKKTYEYEFADEYWVNSKLIEHNIYDLGISKSEWTYNLTTYAPLEDDNILSLTTDEEYRYKMRYCRVYEDGKEYSSEYSKESIGDYTIKDENTKKTFYSYRTREKLVIDIPVITETNFDINSIVIESSEPYQISDNIKYNINGIYDVEIKSDNFNIQRQIEVLIPENYINLIKQYEEEINNLKNQLSELAKSLENTMNEYEQYVINSTKEIENLKNKLNQCVENCKEEINCLNEEINKRNDMIANYLIEINKLKEQINLLNKNIIDKENYINQLLEEKLISEEEIKKLNEKINSFKENIKLLQIENNDLLQKIEEIKNNYINQINELKDKYNIEINDINNDHTKEIEDLNIKHDKELNELNNNYEDKLNELNSVLNNLKNKNSNYEQQIKLSSDLNNAYLNKIKELENEVKKLNTNIANVITEKNANKTSYETQIKKLEIEIDENNNKNKELVNKLEESNLEKDSLNDKLNNYMLKINKKDKLNLFWLYLLLAILYIAYKLRKKSNEKNS